MRGSPVKPNTAVDTGHFGWEPCGLTIVTQDGSPVLECRTDSDNAYDLNVQLSRDLAWDANKRSWRWHKTWRVPDCLVTANVDSLHGISDLEAHLSVVCQAELPHHLEDAGVHSLDRSRNHASLQLVDGRCRFSRLRLVATTSTFGGRMFHFVVSIVRRDGDSFTALASVISTAFAVYSRKNADKKRKTIDRDAMLSGRWSEGYSFVPFEPKELDRTFIKKTTNTDGVLVEEEITNSWDGLLAYFQAPNIRFKIRHPLFLAIRFSNVLVILRDALRFPQENEDALRSFICSCGFPLNCKRDPAVKIGHGEFLPPWLIAFRSASMKECSDTTLQKLADLMKVVKGPALGFVPDDSLLPQRYSATFDVASLGQLYTKLYAIEFAGGAGGGEEEEAGDGGGGGANGVKSARLTGLAAKRAKTKMEPLDEDGIVGFHPCGTPIFHPDGAAAMLNTRVDGDSSSASSHKPSELMRSSFESYFVALHGELRMLLQKVVELVSQCVAQPGTNDVDSLRKAYADFTEALSVHAFVEEHVLFKKLADRVPNVTESYSVDHLLEKGRLDEISNIMKDVEPEKITDLFLKISELAAVHRIHMDKEEVHLLPYFLQNFDDGEISDLIRQCQCTINRLSQKNKQVSAGRPASGHVANGRDENGMDNITTSTNGHSISNGHDQAMQIGFEGDDHGGGGGGGRHTVHTSMTGGEVAGDSYPEGGVEAGGYDADKISLLNPRHQNAIERAMMAAGLTTEDSDSVDPPDNINEHHYFVENGNADLGDGGGSRVAGGGDEVIALIEEMYK